VIKLNLLFIICALNYLQERKNQKLNGDALFSMYSTHTNTKKHTLREMRFQIFAIAEE